MRLAVGARRQVRAEHERDLGLELPEVDGLRREAHPGGGDEVVPEPGLLISKFTLRRRTASSFMLPSDLPLVTCQLFAKDLKFIADIIMYLEKSAKLYTNFWRLPWIPRESGPACTGKIP